MAFTTRSLLPGQGGESHLSGGNEWWRVCQQGVLMPDLLKLQKEFEQGTLNLIEVGVRISLALMLDK